MITSPARGRDGGPGSLLARGFSVVGLTLVLAIAATIVALAAPGYAELQSSVAIRSAAGEAGAAFFHARSLAISRGRNVGLRFRLVGTRYQWTVYADGNGNGIRSADISRGIDFPIASRPWQRNDIRPAILTGTPVPDPGQEGAFLDRLSDPIRFNSSDICSFSPIGESTPGSIYLWDGRDRMAVIRVFGRSAKIRTLYYRRGERTWKP